MNIYIWKWGDYFIHTGYTLDLQIRLYSPNFIYTVTVFSLLITQHRFHMGTVLPSSGHLLRGFCHQVTKHSRRVVKNVNYMQSERKSLKNCNNYSLSTCQQLAIFWLKQHACIFLQNWPVSLPIISKGWGGRFTSASSKTCIPGHTFCSGPLPCSPQVTNTFYRWEF